MNIKNLTIGRRLAIGFGLVCIALVAMVGQGTLMLGRVNAGTGELANKRLPNLAQVASLQGEVNDIAIAMRNMMLNDDPADRARQTEEVVSSRAAIQQALDQLDKQLVLPRARELLARKVELNAKYVTGQQQLVHLIEAGDTAGATAYLNKELRPVLAAYKKAIAEQIAFQMAVSKDVAASAAATYEQTRILMLALGVLTLAATGGLAVWITRSITRPITHALEVANAVAAGDLTSRVEVDGKCEVSQLLAALKTMNAQLAATVGTVRTGTDAIALAAAEVAAGNHDLSARTEQQASSLEETASSMEELTSTVRQNADNARQANVLAETASGVAARGGAVIGQVVDTMQAIDDASRRIADIIGVIDGIAFQTNILALNAAVEAARAGEQGRGFAVVAGEVRSLAQRSAAAAKEIKDLINDSGTKVEAGSRLVREAGGTMGEIVDSVRRVADILGEITAASGEQSAGIEQINEAVTQMDTVTQQNAALVEEAAAAAQSMQEQAGRLAEAVSVFRVDAAAPARAAKPASVARPVPVRPALAAATGDWKTF